MGLFTFAVPELFRRTVLIGFALLALLPAVAAAGEKTLRIDPRHVLGVQDMRTEITSVLEEMGYEGRAVRDPSTGQPVRVVEIGDEFWMLFKAVENPSLRVEAHVRRIGGMTGLHFYEAGTEQLSDTAMAYFRRLKQRLILTYGEDNVSDKRSFFTP